MPCQTLVFPYYFHGVGSDLRDFDNNLKFAPAVAFDAVILDRLSCVRVDLNLLLSYLQSLKNSTFLLLEYASNDQRTGFEIQ